MYLERKHEMHSLDFLSRPLRAAWMFVLIVGVTGPVQSDTLVDDFNDCNDDGSAQKIHRIGGQNRPGGTWDATFEHDGSCAYRLATVQGTATVIAAGLGGSARHRFRQWILPSDRTAGIATNRSGDGDAQRARWRWLPGRAVARPGELCELETMVSLEPYFEMGARCRSERRLVHADWIDR